MYGNILSKFSLIIIIFIFKKSYNYIILPFKTTNIPFEESKNNSNIENFLSQIDTNQLYTTLFFGKPSKKIDFYISMDQISFSILSNNCLKGSDSFYNPHLSETFKNETDYNMNYGSINKACLAKDKCTFYNDLLLSKNISFDEFKFLFGKNASPKSENIDSESLCGTIGLMRNTYNTFLTMNHFIYYLKENKMINSYAWGLFYFDKENSYNIDKNIQSKYDGYLIAGLSNDSYLEIFKTENIFTGYAYSSLYWSFSFNKIFYNDSTAEFIIGNNTPVEFVIDLNYITCTRNYYESIKNYFFKKYLDEKICVEETVYKTYEENNYMIICNSDFKKSLSSFPKIYFFSDRLSYIFNLDYNDVFKEYNNKIYFLIIFKQAINTLWRVGKIFMKKYPFIFDYDQKTISFVYLKKYGNSPNEDTNNDQNNKNDNNKDNKEESGKNKSIWLNVKFYIVIGLLIIAVIIGIFIGKQLWKSQRKMRANELDENYEYIEKFDVDK